MTCADKREGNILGMEELVKWAAVLNLNLSSLLDKKLEPFGINNSQFFYILKICGTPGRTRESIFREVHRNPSNVSRALGILEEKGYIKKEPSGTDRRTCYLYPTEKAQAAYNEIKTIVHTCNQKVVDNFSEEERQIFSVLLKKAALQSIEMNMRQKEKGGRADE